LRWRTQWNTNFVVFKIPRMCAGGIARVNCEDYGYIVLVKGAGDKDTEPVDQSFFRWLESDVTFPTVNKVREDVFKTFNWKTGDPVPPGKWKVSSKSMVEVRNQYLAVIEPQQMDASDADGAEWMKSNPCCTSTE
jgi:hypothetical protein